MLWIDKYPQISNCIDIASKVVNKFRLNPECEFEARLGNIVNGKFVTGVKRIVMDDIIEMMQKSTFVKCEDEWKEEMDLYFMHNNQELRTRVQYDSNSMNVISMTTEKKLVTMPVDFYCESEKNDDFSEQSCLGIRLSLKSETEIKNPPTSTNPYLVRIKQRKRFITENKIWAFDFSMTWAGKDKSTAEYSQMNDDAIYEIECECIDPTVLNHKSDDYIAGSILLKMYDFMPKDSILRSKQ